MESQPPTGTPLQPRAGGFNPGAAGAPLLFRVIAHRAERAGTIITSNLSIREWPRMPADDEAPATATLDRLLHHCHVIRVDGPTDRPRDLHRRLAGGGTA